MPVTLTEQPLSIGCSAASRAGSCIASEPCNTGGAGVTPLYKRGRRLRALHICSGSHARTAGGSGPGARVSHSPFCGGSTMSLTTPWHVISPPLEPTELIFGESLCSFPLCHSRINPGQVSLRSSSFRASRESKSSRDNSCLGNLFLDHPPSVPFPELPLGGQEPDDCG